MASASHIKERARGIATTRQITQAMHLVSTSKMQRARQRHDANRPFAQECERFIKACSQNAAHTRHPYISFAPNENGKTVYIVLGSDRGLCGGFSINVCKKAMEQLKQTGGKLLVSGARARDFFRKRASSMIARSFIGVSENPFFEDAEDIAYTAIELFNHGEVERVVLVYTEFGGMLNQIPRSMQLLPILQESRYSDVNTDTDGEELLMQSVPFALASAVFDKMLESAVCEQSARVASMDSASKNAEELMNKLNLEYNKVRQSFITQELNEIIGGVNALDGDR